MRALIEHVSKRRTRYAVAVRVVLSLLDIEDGAEIYKLGGELVDVRFVPKERAPLVPMSPEEAADLRARLKKSDGKPPQG
jgi:hypothetical protein